MDGDISIVPLFGHVCFMVSFCGSRSLSCVCLAVCKRASGDAFFLALAHPIWSICLTLSAIGSLIVRQQIESRMLVGAGVGVQELMARSWIGADR